MEVYIVGWVCVARRGLALELGLRRTGFVFKAVLFGLSSCDMFFSSFLSFLSEMALRSTVPLSTCEVCGDDSLAAGGMSLKLIPRWHSTAVVRHRLSCQYKLRDELKGPR